VAIAARPLNAVVLLALAGVALLAPQRAIAGPPNLSDADLVAYAAKPFDHMTMMFKRITIGLYHGAPVIAEFPCSDVCPQYTTRIIRFDIAPGAACAAAGGVTQVRRVPFSIAMVEREFCIPKPLAAGNSH